MTTHEQLERVDHLVQVGRFKMASALSSSRLATRTVSDDPPCHCPVQRVCRQHHQVAHRSHVRLGGGSSASLDPPSRSKLTDSDRDDVRPDSTEEHASLQPVFATRPGTTHAATISVVLRRCANISLHAPSSPLRPPLRWIRRQARLDRAPRPLVADRAMVDRRRCLVCVWREEMRRGMVVYGRDGKRSHPRCLWLQKDARSADEW